MKDWYKELVVYQIWPRSFCDGNGDGIGDLEGVLGKLDYLKELGINCIWFSPLYPSPNADYGYDIADYRDIHEEYGSLDLFKKVLDEAHKRNIKVIMDLVVNHTSELLQGLTNSPRGTRRRQNQDKNQKSDHTASVPRSRHVPLSTS